MLVLGGDLTKCGGCSSESRNTGGTAGVGTSGVVSMVCSTEKRSRSHQNDRADYPNEAQHLSLTKLNCGTCVLKMLPLKNFAFVSIMCLLARSSKKSVLYFLSLFTKCLQKQDILEIL